MATVHTYHTLNDYRIFSEPLQESGTTGSKIMVAVGILTVALMVGAADYFLQDRAVQTVTPATEPTSQAEPAVGESTEMGSVLDQSGTTLPGTSNMLTDQQALSTNEQTQTAPQVAPPVTTQPAAKKAESTAMKRQTPAASIGETRTKAKAPVSTPAAASAPAAAASEVTPEPSTQPAAVESQPVQQPVDTSATEPAMPQSMENQSAVPDQTTPTTVQ